MLQIYILFLNRKGFKRKKWISQGLWTGKVVGGEEKKSHHSGEGVMVSMGEN